MKYLKISSLTKLEDNPRIIKDKSFKILCKSIKDNPQYFEARPLILSNRTGKLVIIAGNQRYEAAKHLKLDKVPTFLMEDLTEEKEREIIIRDNVANGEWDWDKLANEWDAALLADWDVDLPKAWTEEEFEIKEKEMVEPDPKYCLRIESKDEKKHEFVKEYLDKVAIEYTEWSE